MRVYQLPIEFNPVFIHLDNLERRRQELARTVARAQRLLERYRRDRHLEDLHEMWSGERVERVR